LSKSISNPFLFVGKQIKDEYGRQIGRIASFKVTPAGRIDGVFVEHGDGEFLSYSNDQIKIDNGNLIISPTLKIKAIALCNEIPLIWRKDKALNELVEKKKIPPEMYDDLHKTFEGALNQLKDNAEELMKEIAVELDSDKDFRVRILLDKQGNLRWEKYALSLAKNTPNTLRLSSQPVSEKNPFLFHKTTHRPWYGEAMGDIARGGCFDMAFCNSKGEVTEGSISNLFVEKNNTLYAPPVTCGLLPGILRKKLIKQGKCKEKILRTKDLLSADNVYCGNSVRGLVKVRMEKN